jgi:hypothetical protein
MKEFREMNPKCNERVSPIAWKGSPQMTGEVQQTTVSNEKVLWLKTREDCGHKRKSWLQEKIANTKMREKKHAAAIQSIGKMFKTKKCSKIERRKRKN